MPEEYRVVRDRFLDEALAEAAGREVPGWDPVVSESLQRLAALCLVLQERAGDKDFHLTCEEVGRLFGGDWSMGSHWLGVLMALGILERTHKGGMNSGCSRYRYVAKVSEEGQ